MPAVCGTTLLSLGLVSFPRQVGGWQSCPEAAVGRWGRGGASRLPANFDFKLYYCCFWKEKNNKNRYGPSSFLASLLAQFPSISFICPFFPLVPPSLPSLFSFLFSPAYPPSPPPPFITPPSSSSPSSLLSFCLLLSLCLPHPSLPSSFFPPSFPSCLSFSAYFLAGHLSWRI